MYINRDHLDVTSLLAKYGVTTDDSLDGLVSADNSVATFTGTRNGTERQFKAIRENNQFRLFDLQFNEIPTLETAAEVAVKDDADRLPTGPGPWKAEFCLGQHTFYETTADTIGEAITWAQHIQNDHPGLDIFTEPHSTFRENSCQWGTGYRWLAITRATTEEAS
ncbi:hypothetical protein [Aeromicrobium sp. 179-A 4D2 NHS]|uniref:hypothetical protein n=1 Tax=Aeromicrobium sp. 179-A 4D2 NHS TaxID=3142375 RepID=UPI0039A32EDD